MNVYCETIGRGKPLVLFHGWGFDHSIWYGLVNKLSNQYQCYLIDLPGFGKSALLPWQSFKDELLSLLPSEFALMGWSLGGLFASRLALEETQVTHLINVASSPYFIKDENWPGIKKDVFRGFYNNLTANPKKVLDEFVHLQLKNSIYEVANVVIPKTEALKEGLAILENWDLRLTLKKLSIPTSYIFGRLDSIVPRNLQAVMQELYPQFQFHQFTQSAHIPFLSETELFISYLEQAYD